MSNFFCPRCKKTVETITIYVKGDEVQHCAECGNTVTTSVYKTEWSGIKKLERILVAEDSKLMRDIAGDTISNMNVAKEVIFCSNGAELIEKYARFIKEKKNCDLLIIDINMPVLGGLSASVAIRFFERGLDLSPTPILFFTVTEMTEEMRKFFQFVKPAVYLHKGDITSAEKLSQRLSGGIVKLLSEIKR